MTHTVLPWKGPCEPDSNFQKGRVSIKTMEGELVASLSSSAKGRARAALIVTAVNSHASNMALIAELVEALDAVSIMLGDIIISGRATDRTKIIALVVTAILARAKSQSPASVEGKAQ